MRGPVGIAVLAVPLLLSGLLPAGAQVTLPLSQFEALRERANPKPDAAPAPPAPFAFESAEIEISAGRDSARIVQILALTVYAEGWQEVPLGEAGSFISARFGGAPGTEGRVEVDDGGWALQVRGRGRHAVTLESVVPLKRDDTATRPTWQLALRLPPAAVVSGRVTTLPGLTRVAARPGAATVAATDLGQVEEVELQGAGLVRREGEAWSFVAAPSGAPATFVLRGRRTLPERAQLPLRFEATSATAVSLSRTQLRVVGWLGVRVAQGRLPEVRLAVPPGLEVVSVAGPIAGWSVTDGQLVIAPQAPVEDALAVEVTLAGRPAAAGKGLASPLLVPAGSRRTVLLVKAAVQGDGLLTLADPAAVRAALPGEEAALPEPLRRAPGTLFAVLDAARPPLWEAEWAEGAEVLAAQVDRLWVDVAAGESGRASYQLWAEVRNRGAQQLTVRLPAGFELVAGSRDGEPIVPGAVGPPGTAGTAALPTVAVPLASAERAQVIHLQGLLPLAVPRDGQLTVPLPALSAPAARVEVRLVLPGERRYTLADATRARPVGPPPGSDEREARLLQVLSSNNIAQQVLSVPGAAATAAALFPRPPGFAAVEAAWSALSADPAPLALRIERDKEVPEWF
jgi:hypothetical protein